MNSSSLSHQKAIGTNSAVPAAVPTSCSSAERYLPQFKRKVLEFAENETDQTTTSATARNRPKCQAIAGKTCVRNSRKGRNSTRMTIVKRAATFGVHPTTVSDWINEGKRQHDLQQLALSSPGVSRHRAATNDFEVTNSAQTSPTENELKEWLQVQRNACCKGSAPVKNRKKASQLMRNETVMLKTKSELDSYLSEFWTRHKMESWTEAGKNGHLRWLKLWCRRVLDERSESPSKSGNSYVNFDTMNEEPVNAIKTPRNEAIYKRILYPPWFKLEIVEYSKIFGQRQASRLFQISQRRIFEWNGKGSASNSCLSEPNSQHETRRTEVQAQFQPNSGETPLQIQPTPSEEKVSSFTKGYKERSQTQVVDVKIEEEVFNWVQSQKPLKVTSTQIREKARELYRKKGHTKIQCSYGWYRRWCKRFELSTSPHDSFDDQVLEWLLQQYDNNDLVTYKRLQTYTRDAISRSNAQGTETDADNGFKASQGWATRFFKRNHLLINWQGHFHMTLPKGRELSVQEFLRQLKPELRVDSAEERMLIAMDEIPLTFASSPNYNHNLASSASGTTETQISTTDSKISRLRRISIKNCEATVMLALTSSGKVLPPMLVVKAQKSMSWDQVYTKTDNPVVVYYSKTTEPTVKSLEKWLDLILVKELNASSARGTRPPVLLWDSYSIHSQMSDKCKRLGVEPRIFPPGCSCKLQPVNVVGRQLLLKNIEEEWVQYINESNTGESSRINLPSTDDIVEWVYKAFKSMEAQKEILRNSFKILDA